MLKVYSLQHIFQRPQRGRGVYRPAPVADRAEAGDGGAGAAAGGGRGGGRGVAAAQGHGGPFLMRGRA